MKFLLKKSASLLLTSVIIITALFSEMPPYSAEAEPRDSAVFDSTDALKENFYSYYSPNGYLIEATDESGNALYRECDPSLTWQASDGILKRYGVGEYAAGSGRTSAASLYFKNKYENFKIEYDYRIGVLSGYRWAGVGFGAENIGGHYVNDGYYAFVEKEGTMRLFNENTRAALIYSEKHTDFQAAAVSQNQWIHVCFSVMNGVLSASYTYKNEAGEDVTYSASAELAAYGGGYVYISSYTQGMTFKNLKISEYKFVSEVNYLKRYSAKAGTDLADALPKSLTVNYTDGSTGSLPVAWRSENYDCNTDGMYKVIGSIDGGEYTVLQDDIKIETYLEIYSYDPEYVSAYYFDNINDLRENFICYTYDKGYSYGALDDAGNSRKVLTDPSASWKVHEDEFVLERCGEGDYEGADGTKGASLLYFKEKYTDFEITLNYRFSRGAYNNSWRWMGIGFGADEYGDCYQTDSYFAVVEKEGTVRLHMKSEDGTKLSRINTGANDLYREQVSLNPDNYTDLWHTMSVRVSNGYCYISYDNGTVYSQSIPLNVTGYIYLFSNTQYMQFKNIKVSRFLTGGREDMVEVWPEEYEVEKFVSATVSNIKKGKKGFSFTTDVNGSAVSLSVSFPRDGGVRITGEKTGFFAPEAYNDIAYEETNGGVDLCSGNERVKFRYDNSVWRIVTQKNGNDSLTFSSEDIFFGYKNGAVAKMTYRFPIRSGERFYGLGERYNSVNQNGYTVKLWNHDPTYHVGGASGDKTESYSNVPVLHSTKGYTVFFNSTYYAEADIGCSDENRYSFDFNGDIFDIYVWNGTPLENMRGYTSVTGTAWIPAKWAFSYWAGSGSTPYRNRETDIADEQYTLSVLRSIIDGYSSMGITPAALYGEGDYINYSASTFNMLKNGGIRALSWNRCSSSYKNISSKLSVPLYELPLVKVLSEPFKYYANTIYSYIDYSNPLSVDLVKELYREKAAAGLHGLMIDMGEYLIEDTKFYNGKTGAEMHNLYSYYYARSMNEAMKGLMGDDFVLFERSGCAGSWQYSASFGGDQAARWYGLRQQVNALLTASASGFSVWGGDIGGLHGRPDDELYMRWVQFSAFSPLMREHGNTADDGLPWTYSEEAKRNFTDYYNLREVLLDHIYSGALKSGKTGVPMTVTLAMAYQDDENLSDIDDEYIFCDNMLVAPVLSEGVTSREVVLPRGEWYDLWSGKRFTGGSTVVAAAAADTIPVYLKSGSVTVLNTSDELSLKKAGGRKALLVTPPENDTETTVLTSADAGHSYSLSKKSDTSFILKKDGTDGCSVLMIYGFKASAVNADGTELTADNFYIDGENTVVMLPDGVETIELYSAGVLRRNNITEISPENNSALADFATYSAPGDRLIEEYDENGKSVFKKTESTDIWRVPYKGVIERRSISEYTSTASRRGASALYFNGDYPDFEIEFSYNYNNASGSWRWISVGFGAENEGDSYYDGGYLALLEQEGTLKLLGDAAERKIKTYRLSNTVREGYPVTDKWYKYRLRVTGGTATLWFGDEAYSYALPNYGGGKIYLHCFTDGILFKDIKITNLSGEKYSRADRFEIAVSKTLSGGKIESGAIAAAGETVSLNAVANNGFLLGGISVTGFNGEMLDTVKAEKNGDGSYSFVMPFYPVVVNADFYMPYDVNNDKTVDVRDLICIKKYLASRTVLINTYSADADLNGIINAADISAVTKRLLQHQE